MPCNSEYDIICKQGLYRRNQVKMRSLEWALIQNGRSPDKNKKSGHADRHTTEGKRWEDTQGESHMKVEGYSEASTSHRAVRVDSKPQKLGEAQTRFAFITLRRNQNC